MFNGLTKGLITLRRLSLECDDIDVVLYSLMFKCQINKEIPLLNTKRIIIQWSCLYANTGEAMIGEL